MLDNFVGRDILNIKYMTPDEFRYLLDLAAVLKAEKMAGVDHQRFHNKNIVAHFEWESTRTRCAFETSAHDLGLGFTYLSNSHFGVKETVKDSVRVFSAMYDAIVIRTQKDEAYLKEIADAATIPVINALDDDDHPTQMLADALTLSEIFGGVGACKGKKLAYVGDCCGTPLWYGRMCALMGMDYYVVGPNDKRYQLNQTYIDDIQSMYDKWAPNNKFVITDKLEDLEGMDVVTTESWIYQNPEYCDKINGDWTSLEYNYESWIIGADVLLPYRVTSKLLEDYVKNPNCVVLHMLPAYHNGDMSLMQDFLKLAKTDTERMLITEGFCISDECFERHASEIFREAGNRQPTIKACLAAVLGI